MKKNYFLAAASFFAATFAFSQQYDLEMRLISPASNGSVAPASNVVTFEIENVGAADVESGKVVWLTYFIGTEDNFSWEGVAQQVDGVQLPQALTPTTTIPSSALSVGLYNGTDLIFNTSHITTLTPACAWIVGVDDDGSTIQDMAANGDPNDADNDNNVDCFMVDPALASVVELSLTDAVEVEVLPESLTINSSAIEPFSYIIFNVNGQLMAEGEVNGQTKVSTSELNNGAYILNVYSNSEKKIVKFAVAR